MGDASPMRKIQNKRTNFSEEQRTDQVNEDHTFHPLKRTFTSNQEVISLKNPNSGTTAYNGVMATL